MAIKKHLQHFAPPQAAICVSSALPSLYRARAVPFARGTNRLRRCGVPFAALFDSLGERPRLTRQRLRATPLSQQRRVLGKPSIVVLILLAAGSGLSITFATGTARCAEKGRDVRVDSYGDPLPKAALRRFGTVRFLAESQVSAMALSPDGKRLVTIANARHNELEVIAEVWNRDDGCRVGRFVVPRTHFRHVSFFPSGEKVLLASGAAKHVYLLDITHGGNDSKPTYTMKHPILNAHVVDGGIIATAGPRNQVIVSWLSRVDQEMALDGHTERVKSAVFSQDGRRLATHCLDGTIRFWNLADGTCTATLKVKRREPSLDSGGAVADFVIVNDESRLQYLSFNGEVRKELGGKGEFKNSYKVRVAPGGSRYCALGTRTALLSRAVDGKTLFTMRDSRAELHVFSTDDQWLAYSSGSLVRLVDARTGTAHDFPPHHMGVITSLAYSPRGTYLIAHASDGAPFAWSRADSKLNATLPGSFLPPAMTLDEERYFSSEKGKIQLNMLVKLEQLPPQIANDEKGPFLAAVTPRRDFLCMANDRKVQAFNLKGNDGPAMVRELTFTQPVSHFCVSAAGKLMVTGHDDGFVRVTNLKDGRKIAEVDSKTIGQLGGGFRGPSIEFVAFTPDERDIIILRDDGKCGVLGLDLPSSTRGHNRNSQVQTIGDVAKAATTLDGAYVVTCGVGNRIVIWETQTGASVWECNLGTLGEVASISSVAISPDMRFLATGHVDGLCYEWSLNPYAASSAHVHPPISKATIEAAIADLQVEDERSYRAVWLLSRSEDLGLKRLKQEMSEILDKASPSPDKVMLARRAIHICERIRSEESRKLLTRIREDAVATDLKLAAQSSLMRHPEFQQ